MEYYDIRKRADKLRAVNIIIGGRGIGKSYSALSFMLEQTAPFVYMRNTDVQLKESSTVFGNPFKRLNLDLGIDVRMSAEGKHYLIQDYTGNEPKLIGYGAALSTFKNLRSVDLSDVEYCLYEEFIELQPLRFRQFDAFAGFYETVNRNRELQGRPPLKCILLSNSQTMNNDILINYGLTERIIGMIQRGERVWSNQDIRIELPQSDVSEAKRDTAHYRLIAGTKAAAEALDNEFAYDSFRNIKVQNLREYRPLCMVYTDTGYPVNFWQHKGEQKFYACSTPDFSVPRYDDYQYPVFLRDCGLRLREASVRGLIWYESYDIKVNVDNLLKC